MTDFDPTRALDWASQHECMNSAVVGHPKLSDPTSANTYQFIWLFSLRDVTCVQMVQLTNVHITVQEKWSTSCSSLVSIHKGEQKYSSYANLSDVLEWALPLVLKVVAIFAGIKKKASADMFHRAEILRGCSETVNKTAMNSTVQLFILAGLWQVNHLSSTINYTDNPL